MPTGFYCALHNLFHVMLTYCASTYKLALKPNYLGPYLPYTLEEPQQDPSHHSIFVFFSI